MKKEKLILSFIATLFGLLVAGIIFYFYQTSNIAPNSDTKTVPIISPTPTPVPTISLTLDSPKDEEVVDNRALTVSGKTQSNAIVVVIINSSEDIVTPLANGDFSTTINLDDGENILEVTAIAPNGESSTIKMTVTYSLEEF